MTIKTVSCLSMLLFALAGCASPEASRTNNATSNVTSSQAELTNDETEGEGICNADRARPLVGQTINASTLQQASELSGAKTVRALRPDQVATLDYSSQRLNLRIDAQNKVASVDCG